MPRPLKSLLDISIPSHALHITNLPPEITEVTNNT